MKLLKLLTYFEANFMKEGMDIKKTDFKEIGLNASEIRRYLTELEKEGVICSLLIGFVPNSHYDLSWFDPNIVDDDTILSFSFKVNLNKVKMKLQENKLPKKVDLDEICYRGVCVNFNYGKMWIEGGNEKSKFISGSKMSKLWRLLLSDIGNIFQYGAIAKELNLESEYTKNKTNCLQTIAQTKKNLIDRVTRLGFNRAKVSSWFNDNNGYGLKKIEDNRKITSK